tara:strand:- start:289 stop:837 length:549 start_codon:yes stop_codon:yes gene_type:complete
VNIPHDGQQLLLYSLVLGLNAQLIYEWGIGQSTKTFLEALKHTEGYLVSCDWNTEHSWGLEIEGLPNWTWHKCSVEEFRKQIDDSLADIIYVDGFHSYTAVSWEVRAFWPFLKDDGLMILHDTVSFRGGPDRVARNVALFGIEMIDLQFDTGMAIIHKRASDKRDIPLPVINPSGKKPARLG